MPNHRIIEVTPIPYTFGTALEEIFFALMLAKRESLQIRLTRPLDIPALNGYRVPNRAIFDITSDYICNQRPTGFTLRSLSLFLIHIFPRLIDRLRRKTGLSPLPYHWNFPRRNISRLYLPNYPASLSPRNIEKMKWVDQLNNYSPPNLPASVSQRGQQILEKLGLNSDDWFVCLHVRSDGFRGDAGRRDHRNSDIKNYIQGIQAVTRKGGWVIRLGDPKMAKLPKLDRVVDYAHADWRHPELDLFLVRHCRFFIGCLSGPWDLAVLFGKPMLTVNMYRWPTDFPVRYNDRGIFKQVYSKRLDRFLSIQEIFMLGEAVVNARSELSQDFILYENNPDEIRNSTIEFLELIENQEEWQHSQLQIAANTLCKQRQRERLFGHDLWTGHRPHEILVNRWRAAARIEMSSGTLSQCYLQDNWETSSR